jgi:hypothetical protein
VIKKNYSSPLKSPKFVTHDNISNYKSSFLSEKVSSRTGRID